MGEGHALPAASTTRIVGISLILGLVFAGTSGFLAHQYMGKTKEQRLSNLMQLCQMARNAIEPVLSEYRAQNISKETALEQVRGLVRKMVYSDHTGDNYIFMSSYEGIMLVQPFEPEKEMTNVWDLQDPNGVYIIRALVDAAQSEAGQGYVSYHYQRPGRAHAEEKMSFVMGIPELGCYIGTGQYVEDLHRSQLMYVAATAALTILLLLLLFALVWASMQEIRVQNKMLRKAERELTAVFDHTYEFMGALSVEGVLTRANRSALDFIEQDEASVVGKPFWDTPWWQEGDKARLRTAVRHCARGEFSRFEITNIRANREKHYVDFSLTPIRDERGEITYLLAEGRDITEQKRLEEQLRQSQKLEAIGQLAGGVAHDFNNILQVILGCGEMAMAASEPESGIRHELDEIMRAATRATTLVRQLLAFSRRQVLRLEILDLSEVVDELAGMVRRVIGEHISFNTRSGPGRKTIRADRGQLEQVLMNLCVNARDAMTEGGRLNVGTERVTLDAGFCRENDWARPGDYVLLTVTDTGSGMDEETQQRVFEPFYTTKSEDKGTGLGLSTVYGIVRQHEGMIQVRSEVGSGTTFSVYLPMSEVSARSDLGAPAQAPVGGNEVILLAEDDETVRNLARRSLEAAGCTVLCARDGDEAVRLFDSHGARIDLVLLDAVMPKRGGRSVYQHIEEAGTGTPALFASGYSADTVDSVFLTEKGLELIHKPYERDTLLRKIRQVLDS